MTYYPKCDACNRVENPKPCGFCGQPVVIRYNTITGEYYISHEDWNSRCPQRPFYGSVEQWNARYTEDALRAEIIKWIAANNAATALINEQQPQIKELRDALSVYADSGNWLLGAGVYDWIHNSDPQQMAQAALDAAGGE